MLDVRRLLLLRDLARLGTIAAVAEAHSYTASAVSQQLTALQREAGVPLIERAGRTVRLTAAGQVLARQADTVLAALESAAASVAAAEGSLRIGAFPSAVRTLLPPALVRLADQHPGLDLTVHELDPAAMPVRLLDRSLDVALLQSYDGLPLTPEAGVSTVDLLTETVHLAGAPSLADCADRAWIAGSPGTLCHSVTVQACHLAGYAPRIRHHVDDFTAVLSLVAAGIGVALVPSLGVVPTPGVTLTPLPLRRRTHIAFRSGSDAHPAIAACVAALRESAS
ncbi:MAG: LysR family transcriptional regulator [Hamadaea sp.]|uniref:LysR family transcriptional regulator n=1 Tax=Hamadaea sp. TaxID=2024425 RepID=UPI0017DA0DFB|nr:LysR family transcriptional regulator [Hamadaea sp.]NUR73003.1 LysR family transcriptional regulator [Hamadaea sp.]NUT18052.1 LysR family transcriptional regulator [Hamadaea sp.]